MSRRFVLLAFASLCAGMVVRLLERWCPKIVVAPIFTVNVPFGGPLGLRVL
jgi:hypothetical protein